ncbi:protein TonB [Flavobacterium gossypii]|jgi:protein TonB|uniref:Protein TonB n=2 Tax=Flavobacterium TaxID=237 RepID=A0A495MRJ7_9FLAO|nr:MULTISPECIES: energy transducer TonB [Flavobacterium]MBA9073847.1 protein TonB [Flavobacterium gossypii]RKS26869.1 protein TonB [Flavobacterium endophyticum]WDO14285.1 energy transducer TonB [Flavobacterium sp. WW92]
MSNSKLDLFEQSWIENVFEGRNKSYGAYELRTNSGKRTLKALLIGGLIFLFLVCIPIISKFISDNIAKKDEVLDEQVVLVNIQEPVKKEEIIVEPVVQKQTQSNVDIQKYVPPVVVDKQVVKEEVAVVDELKKTGSETVKAKEGGEVVLDGTASEIKVDAEVIEEDPNKIYTSVQVLPEFPGGIAGFYAYVKKNYRVPEVDDDVSGNVIVNFVVEKDGSLTDIKVVRDLGYGTGKEAIRMLKSAPKWKPGIQNGKAVRVSYNLPIKLVIKSN